MNRDEIMKCIPHRDDMLILDEATLLEENSAVGKYFVKGTEFFLNGHYPNKKIVPGTILCEMMAQLLAVYCSKRCTGLPLLVSIKNAEFKKIVKPGDDLDISIKELSGSRRLVKAYGEIKIKNELCAKAELVVVSSYDKDFTVA